MIGHLRRRVVLAVPMMFALILILFCLLKAAPGDPVSAFVGNFPVPDEYRAIIIEKYSLDDPLWSQFLSYLGTLARGNIGYSYAASAPVSELIASRIGPTVLLVVAGLFVGAALGVLFGLVSALSRRRGVDSAVNTAVLVAYAVPGFWLGQILVLIFAVNLGWFPTSGFHSYGVTSGGAYVVDSLWHLVLPVAALAAIEFAAIARIMRQSTLEVSAMDYLTTAELKGLPRATVTRRHLLRNAALPVVTVIGYRFGHALAGVLLIEKIFGWPGMGQLLEQSVLKRDNQTILGIVLVIAVLVITVNLVVDFVYTLLDPRIRRA